jgi:hypothetical protein
MVMVMAAAGLEIAGECLLLMKSPASGTKPRSVLAARVSPVHPLASYGTLPTSTPCVRTGVLKSVKKPTA